MKQSFLDKIKASWGTKMYNLIFALLALCLTIVGAIFGGINVAAMLGLFAAIANNVAFFLVILFTLQYFQGGTQLQINKKIFEEGNVAAAIYQAAIVIALALLIGNSIM